MFGTHTVAFGTNAVIFETDTVLFGTNTVAFEIYIVVFGTNIVVFGKLDGVGPDYNRPSTDKLHKTTKKK